VPRWLEIIRRSAIAGAVTGACAVVINRRPGCSDSLAAIFMAFGVCGILREG